MAGLGRRACHIAILALSLYMFASGQEEPQEPPAVASNTTNPTNSTDTSSTPVEPVKPDAPAPPSPAAVQKMLSAADCEAAVAAAQSKYYDVEQELQRTEKQIKNATLEKAKEQKAYDQVFAEGSKEQAMRFGTEYRALKTKMTNLHQRDADDATYKKEYMRISKDMPTAKLQDKSLKTQVATLKLHLKSMKEQQLSLQEQIETSQKHYKLLSKQLPINKELIDQRYAQPLIQSTQALTKVKRAASHEAIIDAGIATQLQPLEEGVKKYTEELATDQQSLARNQKDYRNSNKEIVRLTKKMHANVLDMEATITIKEADQAEMASNEMKNKQKALEEDRDSTLEGEQETAKAKVKAETKDEKEIEVEEAEDQAQPDPRMEQQEKERQELVRQQQLAEVEAHKRIAALQMNAAKQVDTVKAKWAKKLQTEKDNAAGKTLPNPVEDKLEDERASVRQLAEQLRSDVKEPASS